MIKASFFDVDSTLISHKIADIPASALQALYALRRRGVLVFLATGRHRTELAGLPLHGFPFDGYVTLTGQLCYDRDFRLLHSNPFPSAERERIVEIFEERRIPLVLVGEASLYINYSDEVVARAQRDISTPIPPLDAYRGEELYMATAFADGDRLDALTARLSGCRPSRWHAHAIDYIPASGGKVDGLRAVQRAYGIKREEIIAFGDGENDIDMIEHAGIGVAMGNGDDRLKAAADFVTAPVDEDGVASALRHYNII